MDYLVYVLVVARVVVPAAITLWLATRISACDLKRAA
jgi:hypothetical protein